MLLYMNGILQSLFWTSEGAAASLLQDEKMEGYSSLKACLAIMYFLYQLLVLDKHY